MRRKGRLSLILRAPLLCPFIQPCLTMIRFGGDDKVALCRVEAARRPTRLKLRRRVGSSSGRRDLAQARRLLTLSCGFGCIAEDQFSSTLALLLNGSQGPCKVRF